MTNKQIAAMAALLSFASTGVLAQGVDTPRRWYVGADYGEAKLDMDLVSPGSTVLDRDDSSNTMSIRVGYRFTDWFALEAGYTDIGDFSASYLPPCGSPANCSQTAVKVSIDGFMVNSVGIWPIAEHFHLKGALGATWRELKTSVTYSTATTSYSDTDVIFSFSAGIAVPVNDRFEIDLDYTHYREMGLGMTMSQSVGVIDNAESSLVTLGARFKF